MPLNHNCSTYPKQVVNLFMIYKQRLNIPHHYFPFLSIGLLINLVKGQIMKRFLKESQTLTIGFRTANFCTMWPHLVAQGCKNAKCSDVYKDFIEVTSRTVVQSSIVIVLSKLRIIDYNSIA